MPKNSRFSLCFIFCFSFLDIELKEKKQSITKMKKMLRLPQQPWRLHWNATFLCLCFLTGCVRGSKDLCSVYWFHMTESPSNLTLTPEGKRKHLMFTCFYPSEKSVGSFSSSSLSNEYSCIHVIQLLFIEFEFIEQL